MNRKIYYLACFDLGNYADDFEGECRIERFQEDLETHKLLPINGAWSGSLDVIEECDEYIMYGRDYYIVEDADSALEET